MRAAIEAAVPSFEHERTFTWRYEATDRVNGRAMLRHKGLRTFDLQWGPGVRSFLWFGNGEAYTAEVRIATSYRGVPQDLLEHMITLDGVDLLRVLTPLGEPTVPGLSHFEGPTIGAYDIDDRGDAVVEHVVRVHWAQNTD